MTEIYPDKPKNEDKRKPLNKEKEEYKPTLFTGKTKTKEMDGIIIKNGIAFLDVEDHLKIH